MTLEGGEGAGKSAQSRRLTARLRSLGLDVIATREPGGSPHAEALRELILRGDLASHGPAAEALMFSAARIDHLDVTIAPALARGAWVVCDRFADSTRAYQGSAGRLEPEFIARLEQVAVGDKRPDLTLVLDVPPELGLARAAQRRTPGAAADRFEREGLAFHRTLRDAFLRIARDEPTRCVVVDARAEEATVAEIIWAAVIDRLGPFLPSAA